ICFSASFRNSKASCQAFTSLALRTEPVVAPPADCCLFKDTDSTLSTIVFHLSRPFGARSPGLAHRRDGSPHRREQDWVQARGERAGRHLRSAPCTMRQGSASHLHHARTELIVGCERLHR